jgi:hypothetical protein
MSIVEQVLKRAGIRKTQRQLMKLLFGLWLAIPGRINYANLARFSAKSEKAFGTGSASRWIKSSSIDT